MRLLPLLIALFALAACAAPQASAPATSADAQSTPAPRKPMRTGGPYPPVPVEPDRPAVVLDYSCRTNADCAVKNVGNCCGYYPACVNVDSPTDPQGVQAECARKGMASVCGFREISACTCNQGACEAASSALEQ